MPGVTLNIVLHPPYLLARLTEDLLDVIKFPERPTSGVADIVLKHWSSELLQGGPVVEHQPDVVTEQGADAHGEEERDHEYKQNMIPRDSQLVSSQESSQPLTWQNRDSGNYPEGPPRPPPPPAAR